MGRFIFQYAYALYSSLIFCIEKKFAVDVIVDIITDLRTSYLRNVFKLIRKEEREDPAKKFLANEAKVAAKNLETLIEFAGKEGYSVGDKLTWADLLIFDVFHNLFIKCDFLKDFEEKHFKEEFARLGEVIDTVQRIIDIKKANS